MNDRIHPAMQAALRPFAPADPKPNTPPPCPLGEIQLIIEPEWIDAPLVCRFDFQPAEAQSFYSPGCQETMDLLSCWIGSVDISGALGEEKREEIESLALDELAWRKECAEIDAADARREREYE